MKEIEILSTLEGLGWRCDKDEAGDYFCLVDIGEVQTQIIPTIGRRSDHFRASLVPSVSAKNFTAAVAFVLDRASNYVPITANNYVPKKIVDFSLDDVARFSQGTISWASAQNIERGLATYRASSTNSKGAMPLRHLAALVIAGNVNCLANHQFSFEQGDRLESVPYITQDMIERVLLIARNVR